MMLIEDTVLDNSHKVHSCLRYFPPHENNFYCGHLRVTVVSTTNVIPNSTISGIQQMSGSWIDLLTKVCPSHFLHWMVSSIAITYW